MAKIRNRGIRTKAYRLEILHLLITGHRPFEIANKLGKSYSNVFQTIKLMRKLAGAKTTVELIVRYIRKELHPNFPFKRKEGKE